MKYRVAIGGAFITLACSSERASFPPKSDGVAGEGSMDGGAATTAEPSSSAMGSGLAEATGPGEGAGGQGPLPGPTGGPSQTGSTSESPPDGPGPGLGEQGELTAPNASSSVPESSTPANSTAAPAESTSGTPPVPPAPLCNAICCADDDCAEGFECADSACQCPSGQKECDGACIAEAACCTDDECGASSHCTDGTCECDAGSHACDDACVSNTSPQSCGVGCEPCLVPVGGEAGCDGTQCTASCAASEKLCAGACIGSMEACDANCPAGSHECGGVCAQRTSPLACGDSCEPCPAPAHAQATCDGQECDFTCSTNYMRCDDTCVPSDGCCADDDCDAGWVCEANACECPGGTKQCDGQCIPESGCCDDGDCGAGLGCEDNQCVDVAPPQVTAITPDAGATGVLSNAAIKITFNEPMDQASVQTALSISTLTTSSYTLAWNGDGSQLTITPTTALTYAAVTSLSGAARSYTVSVAATARDVEGNRMTAGFNSSFTTLKRVTQSVAPSHAGTGSTYGWATQDDPPTECPTSSGNVSVGNHSSVAAAGDHLTFIQYDLSVVGQTSQVTTFESAKFLATQGAQTGMFYPDGAVLLIRKTYGAMADAFTLADAASHGTFVSSATSAVSKDLTSGFLNLWNSSGGLLMYELAPDETEPSNTKTSFSCAGFSLELKFLAH